MSKSPSTELRILVVDDDRGVLLVLERALSKKGYHVLVSQHPGEVVRLLEQDAFDILITDLEMPDGGGIELVELIQERRPEIPVLVITGYATTEHVIDALRCGAYDFITKPINFDYLFHRLEQVRETRALEAEVSRLKQALSENSGSHKLEGQSVAMEKLRSAIVRISNSVLPVLVTGETGTGKELVAREIHNSSERAEQAFVPVNCGALAPQILESELFGHKKGAFTGAVNDRQGIFESADGGSLFLDEVGEMPPDLQVKMLRVLEAGQILPVGSTNAISVDVRVIGATHRDLQEEVKAGRFREDLFYRLNVVHLSVPPLRDRKDDILPLASHFLTEARTRFGAGAKRFSVEAAQKLVSHNWPGNVRELRNAVHRAAAFAQSDSIDVVDLPKTVSGVPIATHDLEEYLPTLEEVERRHIVQVLRRTGGNKSQAAEILGIDRSTLYRKCQTYSIDA